jgi:hypothetical protein
VDDAEALTAIGPDDAPVALGPAPVLGAGTYGLVAAVPDDEARAIVDLDDVAPPALAVAPSAGSVDPGGKLRFEASLPPGPFVRWMGTGGGTFAEVDDTTTNWTAGPDPGPATILALAVSEGANAWAATDVFVGDRPFGLPLPSGRYLPTDIPLSDPPPALVQGTLVPDDASPCGLRLINAFGVVDLLGNEDPYGTRRLPCNVAVEGPFDPNWLLEHRCTRGQVDGAVVLALTR